MNFGNTGNKHLPLAILVSISFFGYTQNGCLLALLSGKLLNLGVMRVVTSQ